MVTTDQTAATSRITFPPDTTYTPVHAILGGMGAVFFCEDSRNKQSIVLKTFRDELLNNRADRVRFMQEVCDWISLGHHPHIVQAFRVEALGHPTKPYLVLEAIEGEKLGDNVALDHILKSIPSHQLPIQACLKIALGVVRAMIYATTKIDGFVHRDIKPANILIDRNGFARLTDFGVAGSSKSRAKLDDSTLENAKESKVTKFRPAGSPYYISPEQWSADNLVPTTMVDIYSLGLTLSEMLIGQRRVHGNSWEELESVHVNSQLLSLPNTMPSELSLIINKCCAHDPVQRYQSWSSLETALCQCFHTLLSKAAPEEPNYKPLQENRQHTLNTYLTVADSYKNLGLIDTAMEYNSYAMQLAESSADSTKLTQTIIQQAELADLNGNTTVAISELEKRTASSDLDNGALMFLGSLYNKIGHTDKALQTLEQVINKSNDSQDDSLTLAALGNMANALATAGQLDKAVELFLRQLDVFVDTGDRVNEAKCRANLGVAFIDLNQLDKASNQLKKSLSMANDHGDVFGIAHATKQLAIISIKERDVSAATIGLGKYKDFTQEWGDREEHAWAIEQLELLETKYVENIQ